MINFIILRRCIVETGQQVQPGCAVPGLGASSASETVEHSSGSLAKMYSVASVIKWFEYNVVRLRECTSCVSVTFKVSRTISRWGRAEGTERMCVFGSEGDAKHFTKSRNMDPLPQLILLFQNFVHRCGLHPLARGTIHKNKKSRRSARSLLFHIITLSIPALAQKP